MTLSDTFSVLIITVTTPHSLGMLLALEHNWFNESCHYHYAYIMTQPTQSGERNVHILMVLDSRDVVPTGIVNRGLLSVTNDPG